MLSVAAVPCSTFLINIYTWEGACTMYFCWPGRDLIWPPKYQLWSDTKMTCQALPSSLAPVSDSSLIRPTVLTQSLIKTLHMAPMHLTDQKEPCLFLSLWLDESRSGKVWGRSHRLGVRLSGNRSQMALRFPQWTFDLCDLWSLVTPRITCTNISSSVSFTSWFLQCNQWTEEFGNNDWLVFIKVHIRLPVPVNYFRIKILWLPTFKCTLHHSIMLSNTAQCLIIQEERRHWCMNLNVLPVSPDRFWVISDEWVIITGEHVVLHMSSECAGAPGLSYSRTHSLLQHLAIYIVLFYFWT